MSESTPEPLATSAPTNDSYPRFLWRLAGNAFDGTWRFYVWMAVLSAVALVGVNAWAHQVVDGMALTNMTDHVSWGFYIANFTFGVGLAAGAVMMVIPAYLYDDRDMHDVVIIGELLAVTSIIVSLLFVVVDLGRPDRFWHIMPGVGRFNWPMSMLSWDVIVLSGYLLLNLHITGYLIYMRYLGRTPAKRWYVPFVFLSIAWALSIHTVTAFLYSGLGGRPFWNTALLAPRFLVTAFVSGPAFVIVLLQGVKHLTRIPVGKGAIDTLVQVMRVTIAANLFMLVSELFSAFYAGGSHASALRYLFFGLHGHDALVPWIWTAVALNVASLGALIVHRKTGRQAVLNAACVMAFGGIWIEKGMGLIVPGFIPSTLHEVVEYMPSLTEWRVSLGIWAFGVMLLTVSIKVTSAVFDGSLMGRTSPR